MILLSMLALVAMALTLRQWWHPGPDALPIHQAFPSGMMAVWLLVAAVGYVPTWRADHAADLAGDAASSVVGEPVHFVCGSQLNTFFDRSTDFALGYVRWTDDGPEKSSKLRHETCSGLQAFLAAPNRWKPSDRAQTFAVHVLTHEAMHMVGERNEAHAECKALQRDVLMAQALGAREDVAQALARTYFQDLYPRMSERYVSDACKPGGKLDENLPSSPWRLRGGGLP